MTKTTIARRVRIAAKLWGRLQKQLQMSPRACLPEHRRLAARIRRVLTLPGATPIDVRLDDSRHAMFARRMARLAGCPTIWWGTAWQQAAEYDVEGRR